ncbi:glycosyltransferase [Acidobacteriota bacterium]
MDGKVSMKPAPDKPSVLIVTLFSIPAGEVVFTKFLDLLKPLTNKLSVITSDYYQGSYEGTEIIRVKKPNIQEFIFIRALKFFLRQFKLSCYVLKAARGAEIIIFFIGTKIYLLPLLCAKLLRKKLVVTATGLQSKGTEIEYGRSLIGRSITWVFRILERINFSLADCIFVESESAVNFLCLGRYRQKIRIGGGQSIHTSLFGIRKYLSARANLVGYIGRLMPSKGARNFVEAIPLVLREREDLQFLIAGEGSLLNELRESIKRQNLKNKAEFMGWIPHHKLPDYLNELKLLVLPSYTEGLPGIVQHAMACGTIVLAAPVGGIPDLIIEEKTGFILKNNSPQGIAQDVIRALEHPGLDRIVLDARRLVEQEYSYEIMSQKHRLILKELLGKAKY